MDAALHVLFVDDEPRVTSALMRSIRMLEPRWRFHSADGGRQAIEEISRTDIDIVVTDMRMPDMSGSDLIREVTWRYPWVMKIMLSGIVDPALVEQVQRWPHRYLFKPCPPERIRDEILLAMLTRDGEPSLERKRQSSTSRPRILQIDDRLADADLFQECLGHLGDQVELARIVDGRLALEHLKTTERPPHATILRLERPGISDVEFLAQHREQRRHPGPIIVLTGSSDQAHATEAMRHGAAYVLPMPATRDACGMLAQRLVNYARSTADACSRLA